MVLSLSPLQRKRLKIALYGIPLIILIASVCIVGYRYMLDNDEVSHAQIIYLMQLGYRPYTDFFSVYPIIFHALLSPIFTLSGFTLDAFNIARIFMIMLFAIRILLMAIIAMRIFGLTTALIAIPLYLLDPFTIFSAMQIRPDNVMILVFLLGYCIGIWAIDSKRARLSFLSASLLSLSVLILPKILPAAVVTTLFFLVYFLKKNKRRSVSYFLTGLITPPLVYIGYFISQSSFRDMVTQTIFDAQATNNALLYPVKLGNFYWAYNIYVYGFAKKSLTWAYVWVLPLLAAMGVYLSWTRLITQKTLSTKDIHIGILSIIVAAQWGFLFIVHSVYLQYYIPVTWLFALFAAHAIANIVSLPYAHIRMKSIVLTTVYVLYIILTISSVEGNRLRAIMDNTNNYETFTKRWQQIPAETKSFPNTLFRPLSYPIPYGYFIGDIPKTIRDRYPSIQSYLEKDRVPYLTLDEYYYTHLAQDTQQYISAHYTRDVSDITLWIRKE